MEHLHVAIILLFLFCSPWPSAGTTFLTHLGTPCVEDCKPDGGVYKCKTVDKDGRSQTMYCSPQENTDYWGRQCRADSMCGKHGEEEYSWCRISSFSWGYCGLVKDDKKINESGEGTHITSRHRNKRDEVVIETVEDTDHQKIITFSAVPATGDITDGRTFKREASDLIDSWKNVNLGDQKRSNLIKSEKLRIDMQGMIKRNNQLYHNLQIQINMKRRPGESTTISQIFVPQGENVPDDYIRTAFLHSFNRRARVFIDVSDMRVIHRKQ